MQALRSLGEAIQTRVIELHGELMARVLDRLESALDEADKVSCSYAAHLMTYVWGKLISRRIDREFDVVEVDSGSPRWLELNARMHRAKDRLETAHRRMYDAPCRECPACLSRRKPWPLAALASGRSKCS